MLDLPPIPLAMLTGFISGLLLSIPVGPVNLSIINEGARRGFFWALMIGIGASVMDVIYCSMAFTGFSSFFGIREVKAAMEVFTFVFMLYLGAKFLSAEKVTATTSFGSKAEHLEESIEKKLHPHSAFAIGFVRVMGNVGVLLFWIVLAANFMAHDWVADKFSAKSAFVIGVFLGTNLWFCGLSYGVSRGHGQFREKTLLRMKHFSGIGLLALGLIHGIHIAWQLAHHRI